MNPCQLDRLRACCPDDETFERITAALAEEPSVSHAEQQQALLRVVSKIRESLDLETIFKATATEVRQLLNADRVGVFRFYPDAGYDYGEFVSEAVLPGYSSALAARVHDHCFGQDFAPLYQEGRIQAVNDIYKAGLRDCHVQVLAQFQIRANLVVPLLLGETLWGLLCIHQCVEARHWQTDEIEFVQQVALHLGVALQQAELLAQTRRQAEELAEALRNLQANQMQLIQTEKMSSLGQLVAGVAHEINNPVNFIYGNLSYATQYANTVLELLTLYQQLYPDPPQSIGDRLAELDIAFLREDFPKMLTSMQLGTDRIRQIVLSLKNFSRLDEAEVKPVNLHDGLESTLVILRHRLKPKSGLIGIEVIKKYGDLPLVECYASQINQVFMNILTNAIDALDTWSDTSIEDVASPERRPQITIQTRLHQEQDTPPRAVITIKDNGMGIPSELLQRLFDPFFTTKPIGKGTGLGLSICHQIVVERHSGALICRSEVGQGTEFQIEIPVKQPIRRGSAGAYRQTESGSVNSTF